VVQGLWFTVMSTDIVDNLYTSVNHGTSGEQATIAGDDIVGARCAGSALAFDSTHTAGGLIAHATTLGIPPMPAGRGAANIVVPNRKEQT
jgi:hypothetical protein